MDYFDALMKILKQWDHLGSRTTARGVRLIGKVPHVAPMAYMHDVYEPLSETQIHRLEEKISHPLPSALRAFYKKVNGLRMFNGALSIQGLTHDYSRALTDEGMYQPVSLEDGNVCEKPKGYSRDMVVFGCHLMECQKIYMKDGDEKIIMCPRRNTEPTLFEWPDFETFLLSEAERLSKLFSEEGRLIDKNMPTIPMEALRRQEKIH